MEEITVHKIKFSLDEVSEALHIKNKITHVYSSTYISDPYIEFTLDGENE